jgi:ribonucleoside-diphosphate reductase alpha chain
MSTTPTPERERLPTTRTGFTGKLKIGDYKMYVNIGLYEDGRPGEVFITAAKDGSTLSGLLKTVSILTSVALQHGISIDYLRTKFEGMKFEPSGYTGNAEIPQVESIVDYVFRWIAVEAEKRKKNQP